MNRMNMGVVYYVIFAIFAEIVLDEEGSNSHAHVSVDIRNAVLPSFRLLLPAVKHRIKVLLEIGKALIQVIEAVSNEAPEKIIGQGSIGTIALNGLMRCVKMSPNASPFIRLIDQVRQLRKVIRRVDDYLLRLVDRSVKDRTQISSPRDYFRQFVQFRYGNFAVHG